jgi:hypothetical protein
MRDRIRFYIIPVLEKNPKKENVELAAQFKAETLPKLVVLETYDAVNEAVKEQPKEHIYDSKDYKLKDLLNYFDKFARQTKKDEIEDVKEKKIDQQKGKS